MKTMLLTLALTISLPSLAIADIQGFATGLSQDTTQPLVWKAAMGHQPPGAEYQGAFYTTPDACTYRRIQAPGHAVSWFLIVNPHHIGKPAAHRGCPGRL